MKEEKHLITKISEDEFMIIEDAMIGMSDIRMDYDEEEAEEILRILNKLSNGIVHSISVSCEGIISDITLDRRFLLL